MSLQWPVLGRESVWAAAVPEGDTIFRAARTRTLISRATVRRGNRMPSSTRVSSEGLGLSDSPARALPFVRFPLAAVLAAACVLVLLAPASARSQESGNLTGRWVLNRNQSQVDKEVGFNPAWLAAGTRSAERESGGGEGGGRGRRGSGGGQQGGAVPRESEEDSKRVQQLSAEVRMPSPHLTIIDSRGTVTITDADDVSRTLHTDGNDDYLQIHGLPITAVTVRDSGHVVVRYKVEQGRELRYTYTRETAGPKLTVDIQFVEGGRVADTVQRVYDLIGPDDPFPMPDVTAKTERGAAGGVPAIPLPAAAPASGLQCRAPGAIQPAAGCRAQGTDASGDCHRRPRRAGGVVRADRGGARSGRGRQVEERRLHRADEHRRGLVRLRQRDHRQPVDWIVRVSLRPGRLYQHHRAALVSAVAGPGPGVAPAQRRHQRRRRRRTLCHCGQGNIRISGRVHRPDQGGQQVMVRERSTFAAVRKILETFWTPLLYQKRSSAKFNTRARISLLQIRFKTRSPYLPMLLASASPM